MFIPVLLWCRDPKLALPSLAIPSGQRFLNFKFAPSSDLIHVQKRGANAGAAYSWDITDAPIQTCILWVNNLFVNPEVHDIFLRRVGFTMIRVHREFKQQVTKTSESLQLVQLKWPTECLFVGVRPLHQKAHPTRWHKFTLAQDSSAKVPNSVSVDTKLGSTINLTVPVTGISGATGTGTTSIASGTALFANVPGNATELAVRYDTETTMVDKFSITLHSIPLYKDMPAQLFNSYMTYNYGCSTIVTPTDTGAYMINFCLYPGNYQPSGYVNASRAREFYIEFTSSVINTTLPANTSDLTKVRSERNDSLVVSGELVVIASAINFLLITDGSAILRYST
jgi:hypothetical protein